MRPLSSLLALALAYPLVACSIGRSEPTPPLNPEQIAGLIAQLGSVRYKEREAAVQALDALGERSLDALRKAAQSADPEVRRRAEGLAQQIQKRLETTRLLAPKKVHLVYDDTPVDEAIADFARKTGFPVQFARAGKGAPGRVTLDTGETTFWEALDQLCKKAGLVERGSAVVAANAMRNWEVRAGLPGQPIAAMGMAGAGREGPLTLSEGHQTALPTHYAGAVRIRALPANSGLFTRGKDETLVVLQVTPQPNLSWQQVVDVRVDQALDDAGQNLLPSLSTGGGSNAMQAMPGGIVWDAETGRPVADLRDTAVRLKLADKPSRVLKELRGVVAAHAQTPTQPIVTVDDVMKSAGKTVKGPGGEALKVVEAVQQDNGRVKISLLLSDANAQVVVWAPGGGRGFRGGRGNQGVIIRGGLVAPSTGGDFTLYDTAGKEVPIHNKGTDPVFNNNGIAQAVHLTFQPREGQADPARLVYTGRRTVMVEIPFVLRDVPLP